MDSRFALPTHTLSHTRSHQFAAARGDVPMLHLLIDYGADVNARDDDTLGGCTSLHYAVQMNNFEVGLLCMQLLANKRAHSLI